MFHKESNKVKVTNCCGLQGGKMFKDYLLTVEAPCRKKKKITYVNGEVLI